MSDLDGGIGGPGSDGISDAGTPSLDNEGNGEETAEESPAVTTPGSGEETTGDVGSDAGTASEPVDEVNRGQEESSQERDLEAQKTAGPEHDYSSDDVERARIEVAGVKSNTVSKGSDNSVGQESFQLSESEAIQQGGAIAKSSESGTISFKEASDRRGELLPPIPISEN